ncbi:MAG: hypothetical protein ABSF15_27650 [Candidatus Sulfotelmatobacter sp.]
MIGVTVLLCNKGGDSRLFYGAAMGAVMTAKCSNPSCSVLFRYLEEGLTDVRDSFADGEGTMPDDWDEHNDVAAGSSCPIPDCGALAVAYRSTDGVGRGRSNPWEFTCPRCGIDFTVPENELIFQSVPTEWLLARVRSRVVTDASLNLGEFTGEQAFGAVARLERKREAKTPTPTAVQ